MYESRVRAALPGIRDRIAESAGRSGRDPASVRLVAVTKAHPLEAIHAAVAAGIGDVGENRVEELEWKHNDYSGPSVRWHMVGHVQSRKAERVAPLADLIHSVDTVKLARRLARAAGELGRSVVALAQVNVSGEEAKSGLEPASAVEAIHEMAELPGLEIQGLMTMAPFEAPEAVLRTTFSGLREVSEAARRLDGRVGSELSMGMTDDFGIAIEEGSTMIRLGTALFGKRPT